MLGTAMCEVCAAAQRRGSLGNALDEALRQRDDDDRDDEEEEEELHFLDAAEEANLWPPHPFQYVPDGHQCRAAIHALLITMMYRRADRPNTQCPVSA